ncbi:S41 family peptidase [Erythrobacter sp. THAF29]|uniref:S41 family peptidase n=1 Tax=Erythrobacter sp. THAF29 TaxID=2587851 RepID=UPI0012690CB7|nr:S41 family peptidase [Erythrobacter sp. THAF29]QFT78792.1 Peptidase family S41 [Erythrobacter sp. THAF29]
MNIGRTTLSATLSLALVACGGGGNNNPGPIAGGPTPAPPPTANCSLSAQQDFADDVLDQWYLFPNLLDNTVNKANFSDLQSYLDARVAPARAQNRDRGFTFATSIAEENALINSGSSAGFGIRLIYDINNNRVFIAEAYENAPGFAAGMDRGTELVAIGTDASNLTTVSSLMASGGPQAVIDALGPSDPGVTRVIRFAQVGGAVVEQSIAKADFSLDPVSDRYGALVLNDGGKKVGYLNLRTFIVGTSDRQLVDAFQEFSNEGVTEFIIDFRYNGGGLVRIADLMGDLMRGPNTGQIFSKTIFNDQQSGRNSTELFESTTQFLNAQTGALGPDQAIPSVNPIKIAFIGRGGTASASELVINSMLPYVDPANIALIGRNTSGKPVGQFGFDLDECDLRIRAVTFRTVNADDEGEYFSGLAGVMPNTCIANDDIFTQFGDPSEASIAQALSFLRGQTCNPISGGAGQTAQGVGGRELLQPRRPNAAQHEIPGLF